MFNIAICLNSISFAVAKSYGLKYSNKTLFILYDEYRTKQSSQKINNIKILKISKKYLYLFSLLSRLGFVQNILIPHQRQGRRVKFIMKHAKSTKYIDDGLDTLRDKPNNFFNYDNSFDYYTFNEYEVIGKWLEGKNIYKIGTLKDLITLEEEKFSFHCSENSILLVESPGLSLDNIDYSLNKNYYIFKHPVKSKQVIPRKGNIIEIDNTKYSLEKTLSEFSGKEVFFGETMSFFIYKLTMIKCDFNINIRFPDKSNFRNIETIIS